LNKTQIEEISQKPNGDILKIDYSKLLDSFFNDLQLYQDSYKTTKYCLNLINKLNELIGVPFEEGSKDYQNYILSNLNEYAGEVKFFNFYSKNLF